MVEESRGHWRCKFQKWYMVSSVQESKQDMYRYMCEELVAVRFAMEMNAYINEYDNK
jgi:hypothetical protein